MKLDATAKAEPKANPRISDLGCKYESLQEGWSTGALED